MCSVFVKRYLPALNLISLVCISTGYICHISVSVYNGGKVDHGDYAPGANPPVFKQQNLALFLTHLIVKYQLHSETYFGLITSSVVDLVPKMFL